MALSGGGEVGPAAALFWGQAALSRPPLLEEGHAQVEAILASLRSSGQSKVCACPFSHLLMVRQYARRKLAPFSPYRLFIKYFESFFTLPFCRISSRNEVLVRGYNTAACESLGGPMAIQRCLHPSSSTPDDSTEFLFHT